MTSSHPVCKEILASSVSTWCMIPPDFILTKLFDIPKSFSGAKGALKVLIVLNYNWLSLTFHRRKGDLRKKTKIGWEIGFSFLTPLQDPLKVTFQHNQPTSRTTPPTDKASQVYKISFLYRAKSVCRLSLASRILQSGWCQVYYWWSSPILGYWREFQWQLGLAWCPSWLLLDSLPGSSHASSLSCDPWRILLPIKKISR